MEITKETEELFIKWAEEAARREKCTNARPYGPHVLPLRKRITDYLQGLAGGDVVKFVGQYKIQDYVKLHTDYAKAVARTTFSAEQTQATLDSCASNGNDLVEVWDVGTDCEICKRHEGIIYSISGNNPKYPPLKEKPPFHSNCRHGLMPTSEEAITVRAYERPAFEGLDPDGRCIMKFDGETLTNREWAELLVYKYGDKEAAVWLASLKNIPAAP